MLGLNGLASIHSSVQRDGQLIWQVWIVNQSMHTRLYILYYVMLKSTIPPHIS